MTVVEVIIVEEAQTPSAAAIVVEFPVEVAVRRQEVERMVLVEPGRVVTEEEEEVMTVEPVIVVNRVPVAEVWQDMARQRGGGHARDNSSSSNS